MWQNKDCTRSWVEIDLAGLKANYCALRAFVPKELEIMAVVKANGYGHGAYPVSFTLSRLGVKHFAVATLEEAVSLRKGGLCGEILVLGYTPPTLAPLLMKYNITQALVSKEHADGLLMTGVGPLNCHFAIDSGMHRIGLNASDPVRCALTIRQYAKHFHVKGIFTHLCAADSAHLSDVAFTKKQLIAFQNVLSNLSDLPELCVHALNSAGSLWSLVRFLPFKNLVRIGILLYGLSPMKDRAFPCELRPFMTWKTTVGRVENVSKGESIGYGRSYFASRRMRVATLSTGYADGYRRALSNHGWVLLRGKKAPIVGRICMDQMMVDVTDIPHVCEGDTAVLLGKDEREEITADEMGAWIGTIGYEIVTAITSRVTRVYKE